MSNMDFSGDELIAIYSALQMQISESTDYLNDSEIPFTDKPSVAQMLNHSQTACAKIKRILDKNGIQPYRN